MFFSPLSRWYAPFLCLDFYLFGVYAGGKSLFLSFWCPFFNFFLRPVPLRFVKFQNVLQPKMSMRTPSGWWDFIGEYWEEWIPMNLHDKMKHVEFWMNMNRFSVNIYRYMHPGKKHMEQSWHWTSWRLLLSLLWGFKLAAFLSGVVSEMPLVRNNFGQECEKNQRSFRSFEHV